MIPKIDLKKRKIHYKNALFFIEKTEVASASE
jgi:hypothetical protein